MQGPHASRVVALLFEQPPVQSSAAILQLAAEHLRGEVAADDPDEGEIGIVFHPGHRVELEDAVTTAATALVGPDDAERERWAAFVPHSRRCRDAAGRLRTCTTQIVLTEMFSTSLPRAERHELFVRVVETLTAKLAPTLVVAQATQEILDPVRLAGEPGMLLANARLFRVGDSDHDKVMDTVGLAVLGLPDLQVRFTGLDPGDMAAFLYDVADYLYEHGDVIADGHTIEGIRPATAWRCRHATSSVGPRRPVIDIDPGRPYAVGGRG
jgi:Domain of unknown function (DUF4261)